MKSKLVIAALTLAALPLVADEAKKKSGEKPMPSSQPTVLQAPPNAANSDSPLVAAAKRTKRLGKKPTNVITNDTLKDSRGTAHITTAATEVPVYTPPAPQMSQEEANREKQRREREGVAKKKAELDAEAKKKAEERDRRVAAAAAAAESGYFNEGVDPAQAEEAANQTAKEAKQEQKPPQD